MKKKGILLFFAAILFLSGCSGTKAEKSAESEPRQESQATAQEDQVSPTDSSVTDVVQQQVEELKEKEKKNRENKEVVNIEEKVYLSQMTDVYMNTSDYVGRRISWEGYVLPDQIDEGVTGAVVRNTPGCCGDDGLTGFYIQWAGAMPAENDWVRVTGVLTVRAAEDNMYFLVEAEEIEVMGERGLEFVSQ